MGKKKFDPSKEVDKNCEILRSTPKVWIRYRDEGGSDPAWADGANMNLLRNHMIYAKQEILRLCAEYQIPEPKELFIPIPSYVDSNYFAKPNSDRAQRVLSSNLCCNLEEPCTKKEMKSYSIQKYTQMQFMYKKEY